VDAQYSDNPFVDEPDTESPFESPDELPDHCFFKINKYFLLFP
jgi:hypothetical protein